MTASTSASGGIADDAVPVEVRELAWTEAVALADRAGLDLDDYDLFLHDLAATLVRFAIRPSPPRAADAAEVERQCTCYPGEAPVPCRRQYALSNCLATQPEAVRTAGEIAEDEMDRLYDDAMKEAQEGDAKFRNRAAWALQWLAARGAMLPADRAAARQAHQDQREEGGR